MSDRAQSWNNGVIEHGKSNGPISFGFRIAVFQRNRKSTICGWLLVLYVNFRPRVKYLRGPRAVLLNGLRV